MLRNRLLPGCVILLLFAFSAANAATPPAGTVSEAAPVVNWTGAIKPATAGGCGSASNSACDNFALTIVAPSSSFGPYTVTVQLVPQADWDLEIYDPSAKFLKGSGGGPYGVETVTLFNPPSGTYTVAAAPFAPAIGATLTSYTASATLAKQSPVSETPPATENVGYANFACPPGNNCSSGFGEPSIGVNWKSGAVMFAGGGTLKTYRVTNFNDAASPPTATWTNVSGKINTTPRVYADPILFTDPRTGRTFAGQEEGLTPFCTLEYTDDDGATWLPSQGSSIISGIDHETIGGGPLAAPLTRDPNLPRPAYPNGFWYCAQELGPANCALSLDGGITFGPAVTMWTTECGGLHGHVKVSPVDGTVYVPNKNCQGQQGLAVSTNNGINWTIRKVPGSTGGDSDPSIGIGSDGTVYFGFVDGDGHPKIAVTRDKGVTWQTFPNNATFTDVGIPFGIQNSVFPAVVAGDGDRAAFAFHGTSTAGAFQDASFPGTWDLYVAHTYDGGQTWTTVKASADPTQRGCIWLQGGSNPCRNLLDFMDAAVDEAGRMVVGFADGCTGACATDPANFGKSVWATIARQSTGKRLFAQFDPPASPGTLQFSSATYAAGEGSGTATIVVNRTGGAVGAVSVNYSTSNGTAIAGSDYTTTTGTLNWADGDSTPKSFNVPIIDDATEESAETVNLTLSAAGGGATLGSSSAVLTIADNDGSPACTAPGPTVTTDPAGDQTGGAQLDVQSLSVSEPYTSDADQSVTFTLNVANLASPIPPNAIWRISFTVNDTTGTPRTMFVQMDTTGTQNLDPTTPEFDYGYSATGSITQGNGGAVSGSYTAAGVITIKAKAQTALSFSDATGAHQFDVSLNPGMVLSNVAIFTQTLAGAVGTGATATTDSSSNNAGPKTYLLRGNLSCKPRTGSTPTTTTLTSSLNPSNRGQAVTFTATVAPSAATGTVTFKDGAATLGTGTLSGGTAAFATSSLSAGAHSITAAYSGDANYAPSASGSLTQTVNASLAGTPRFDILTAPPGLGDGWGEPSIGVNWQSERVFSNSAGQAGNGGTLMSFGGFGGGASLTNIGAAALRVTCSDCSSPADTLWEKSAALIAAGSPRVYGDPILFTDHDTGRTFISQLFGLTPLSSGTDFTDDDGKTIVPTVPTGIPSGLDHQTIGGGPYHAPMPSVPPGTVYKNAVYYCSQDLFNAVPANCSLSVDGGLTWGPAVPTVSTGTQCGGGIHGHVKVGPDGTVYVPHRFCSATGTTQGLAISTTNGVTWMSSPIPGTSNGNWDPSVAIGKDGAVYVGMDDSDRHPRIAVSHNGGQTWSTPVDVGVAFNIQKTAFPAVVAGDAGRAAFAFLGTPTPGDDQSPSYTGEWHLYLATTFDGGETWTTTDLTPTDPVQRGAVCAGGPSCTAALRNLLDFMGATIDKEGRVVVGFADGCITPQCISGGPNDAVAKAAIARQSGGKRMFSAFDPLEPSAPKAPKVSAVIAGNVNHVIWSTPDHGGSPVASFKLYKRTGDGPFNLLAVSSGNSYDDSNIVPGTPYSYRVTAVNALGEGPYCGDATPVLPADSCHEPGPLVVNELNAAGTDNDGGQNTPPDPRVNIQGLYVSEPDFEGAQKLVFTLYVKSSPVNAVPPSTQWFIIWNKIIPETGFDRWYVAMKSDALGAISFEYGKVTSAGSVTDPNINTPNRIGDADGGSYDPLTGRIRIVLSTSKAENIQPGQSLTGLNVRTFFAHPDAGPRSQAVSSDITDNGTYTLIGNCTANRPPVATNDNYATAEDATLTVAAPGVLANDSDPENNALTVSLVSAPAHGTVSLSPGGSFTYLPFADFNGVDSFTYKANDGKADSNVATVTIAVSEINDPPAAGNDSATTNEDTAVTINVGSNDSAGPSNESGQTLTVTSATTPAHGTASVSSNTITYTPEANYSGSDSFSYTVCDDGTTNGAADSQCGSATVSVTITPVNDAPVANNDAYAVKPNATLTVTAPGVLINDGDVDSATLRAVLVTSVSHGTLTLNADGSFTYTPASSYKGPDSFTYKANDGALDSNVATVSIDVTTNAAKAVKATGSGEVAVSGGVASFGFDVKRSTLDGVPTGQLNYYNHARNLTVQSTSITSLNVSGTSATFSGTCTKNGAPCTFTVTTEDNGEPGKGKDRFTIAVSGEPVEGGPGPITSGNVQIK